MPSLPSTVLISILLFFLDLQGPVIPLVLGYVLPGCVRLGRKAEDPSSQSRRSVVLEASKRTSRNRRDFKGKKEELDSLLLSIGLKPVPSKKRALPDGNDDKRDPTKHSLTKANYLLKSASDIDVSTQLQYARNGHSVLRKFVDPSNLQRIRHELEDLMADQELLAWQQKVHVASNSRKLAMSCKSVAACQTELEKLGITASLPFLQYFNTWRKLSSVKDLAFSLAEAASVLLDVPSVRLYQDSVFWKRVGDGPTPWHVDARMAPFDTPHFLTFWIPLQAIPQDGTALLFCSKSHADFALAYWNSVEDAAREDSEWNRLENRYHDPPVHYMPMALSDLTVHSGWTLHCADGADCGEGNRESRMALAISFVDARAELRADVLDDKGKGDNEDRWSYQDWAHHIAPRMPFEHDLVPIVWPRWNTTKCIQ